MTQLNSKKIKIVFCFFLLSFSSVLFKAFQIQVIDNDALILRSQNQIFRETKVYPRRGHIYDRNGSPLAINIQTYSVFIMPQDIENPKETYRALSQLLPNMSHDQLLKRVSNRTRFTFIVRKVELSKAQVEAIRELKGVYVEAVPKRYYPNHEVLGQVLGFVGLDNIGLSGVEFLYDKELRGEPHVVRYVRDNKGRAIKYESQEVGSNAQDIHLTIDKDLQAVVQNALREVYEEYEADGAGMGVMDPETGEILAIANYPSFDPNNVRASKEGHRRLAFATDPIEPGSTFKTFTIASALENKVARPDTNYYCEEGRFKVGNHVITEAESRRRYEWLSMEEILRHSSNIGTTKIAFDLTYPKLKKTLTSLGIGIKTGIEIAGESRGILTDNENVPPLSLSNISFGQGVATTGVQMLRAYSAIANGGFLVQPTIIKSNTRTSERQRVLSEETTKEIERMLVSAVEDGTGGRAKIKYFTIAGKTSTAQRVSPKGGYEGYVPGFIGYPVGVKKPFVVYVYIDNPKGNRYYGNIVASPVFKKVAEYLLYKNKEFTHLNIDVLAEDGDEQMDQVKTKLAAKRVSGEGLSPDFVGLDKITAEKIASDLNLTVIHRGIGVVNRQIPGPGDKIDTEKPVVLYYSPPTLK